MSHNKYKIFEKICIGCGKQFIITSRNIKRRKLRGRPDTLCTACMHAQDIVEKYGEERAKQLLENLNAKRIKTNLRKYNVKNVHQHPDVIKKTVETNVKNHGVESVMQIPEVREKRAETQKQNTGYAYTFESPELYEKAMNTTEQRFSVRNIALLPVNQEKLRSKETQQKREATHMQNHGGIKSPFQLPDFHEKRIEGCMRNYNTPEPQILHIKGTSKIEQKLLRTIRYALTDGVLRNTGCKLIYNDLDNPETEEIAKKYCITFSKNLKLNHTWDGVIINDRDGLAVVIEYDSERHHGGYPDYDGEYSDEFRDNLRFQTIPDGVKYFIVRDTNIDTMISELSSCLNIDYEQYIMQMYHNEKIVPRDIPEYKDFYSDKEILFTYSELSKYGFIKDKQNRNYKHQSYEKRISLHSQLGNKIVNYFYPSIFKAHIKNKLSPYEAWYHTDENGERDLLLKCIRNRFIYADIHQPYRILQGFSTSEIARKITVFSPSRARLIAMKYLSEFDTVFDPFSGFGGRLLGICSLGKSYIGQDINATVVQESNTMIKWFKDHDIILNATVKQQDILTDSPSIYPCILTCPPYKDIEIWYDSINNTPIISKYTAEEWIDIILSKYKCKRYVFIIDSKCNKYNNYMQELIPSRRKSKYIAFRNEKIIVIDK